MTYRRLKKQIIDLLQTQSLDQILPTITRMPARQTINPLFSLLCHSQDTIRWHAVSSIGAVVAKLADQDLGAARIYMRRLMWHLNDESGGIGWGASEAMGEIMARHKQLAEEYAAMLISYLAPWGNYLEYEPLQYGTLWAIGRLGHSWPDLVGPAAPLLEFFLKSPKAALCGMAAWAAGPMLSPTLKPLLKDLCEDDRQFLLYLDGCLIPKTVSWAAETALDKHSK